MEIYLAISIIISAIVRIAPKVLLPGEGAKMVKKDTLCQKSGYRGRNG
jgi:hypothetical protein